MSVHATIATRKVRATLAGQTLTALVRGRVVKASLSAHTSMVTIDGAPDKHYTHDQVPPATLWTVSHGLGKIPSVAVFDSAGDEVWGKVTILGLDTLTIEFTAGFAGKAYCN